MKKLNKAGMLSLNPGDEIKVVDLMPSWTSKCDTTNVGKVVKVYEAGGYNKIKMIGVNSFGKKFTQNIIINSKIDADGNLTCTTKDGYKCAITFSRSIYMIKENPKTAENKKKEEENLFAFFRS